MPGSGCRYWISKGADVYSLHKLSQVVILPSYTLLPNNGQRMQRPSLSCSNKKLESLPSLNFLMLRVLSSETFFFPLTAHNSTKQAARCLEWEMATADWPIFCPTKGDRKKRKKTNQNPCFFLDSYPYTSTANIFIDKTGIVALALEGPKSQSNNKIKIF